LTRDPLYIPPDPRCSDDVARAMLAVPRGSFVPVQNRCASVERRHTPSGSDTPYWMFCIYNSPPPLPSPLSPPPHPTPTPKRDEAYVDAPIRVEADGYNISAPHM
jgi:hypothetical protein